MDLETPDQYRFSGYNLPMLQLDSTGPSYYYIPTPHPYYSSPQPTYWQKPRGSGAVGAPIVIETIVAPAAPIPKAQTKKTGLYPMLDDSI